MTELPVSQRSVLFLTLDSCRYDSFLEARTPNFDKLGIARAAGTHGTYTLPAHTSFFMGYLPSVIDPPYQDYYSPEVRQLWRLASGRARDPSTVGVNITAESVPKFYQNAGFKVLGTGGVRWFRHAALRQHFEKFHFYGKNDQESVFTVREPSEFPLNHIDELVEEIGADKFFLFMNCPETHVPYNTGASELPSWAMKTIEAHKHIWGLKNAFAAHAPIKLSDLEALRTLQIQAVEEVDRKFGLLLARISQPLLVIIAADHGECFGEDNLWGHGYPHPKVTQVPLIIATIN